jgi:hypothetical protein
MMYHKPDQAPLVFRARAAEVPAIWTAATADPDHRGERRIPGDVVGPTGEVAGDWGLHLIDVHLAMGDLLELVSNQARAWLAR